ncbi:oxidoreductase [Herbidospora sp. NEAU-GS84]|uniref:Oxidoreductase n=1 Tax=Herbidospora solisilvae TaxID=2696284 RepID=A0A7C9JCH2_9ACTN|nr:siderophore-interacting protein [Herbidospora solisilvae]NAS23604.1 oxidoreductase [Herbidospora solisilvae]
MARITERLADLASGAFFTQAVVTAKTALSEHFVRVELRSDRFRTAPWTPGCKVQLRTDRGTMTRRTYTPFGWDTAEGTVSLVAYVHGAGPAARWFDRVTPGDACELFGPRRSIDLTGVASQVVFVGDETSVGLAAALGQTRPDGVTYLLEATDPAEYTKVLAGLGVTATVVPKTADRRDLLAAAGTGAYDLVVTGDAATVGPVRRAAGGWTPAPGKVFGKAYWAEGRTGLD